LITTTTLLYKHPIKNKQKASITAQTEVNC